MSKKSPSEISLENELKNTRVHPTATPVADAGEKQSKPLWLIIFLIALIFLILTVIVGHFVFGSGT